MSSKTLAQMYRERVAAGLSRRSLTTASKWACECRVLGGKHFPGKWTFDHHPWLKDMHDSLAEKNVGMKAAQMGFTETVMNIAWFNMDIHHIDVLYVLPTKTPDASDFSAARFDSALELSPHLWSMFSDVKNVGHKKAGPVNFYLRGANSRSGLKSVPVGLVILDELDEMNPDNVPLAWERMSGQLKKQEWKISTATIDGEGIHKEYLLSSQNHYFFKCPCCSRFTELTFPDSLVITAEDILDPRVEESHIICKECKGTIQHKSKEMVFQHAEWVESLNRDIKGWHINQLYSPTVEPAEIAKQYLKAQFDKTEEQEFWNSKIGVPHIVKGARITDEELRRAQGSYLNDSLRPGGIMTMGVDVGTWLHYEIDQWIVPGMAPRGTDLNMVCKPRILKFGKVLHFEELDDLMREWRILFCVVDMQPERRKVVEFANRFYGHVRGCWYPNGLNGKEIHLSASEPSISVDRTSWLDLSLGRFHANPSLIQTPVDLDIEYKTHLKALIRKYEKDKQGNQIGIYVKSTDSADHYAHARNYAEIALPQALAIGGPRSMGSIV